ncbi:MAG: endolytic transglycosylase MltG [Sphingomonas sp.]|nr:endolytic transglycosylase MltG [Sphingomonas sp.]RZV49138.1 MAG: endolytic transglycosylase MltG [Sphingomonadaceae bacterium]
MKKLLILLLLLGAAAFTFIGYGWWGEGPGEQPDTIIVEEGTTLNGLGERLAADGKIVISPTLWRIGARLFGGGDPIQAGEFRIPPGTSASRILDIVQHDTPYQRMIAIPEGMPSVLVQEKLAKIPYLEGEAPLPPEGSVLPQTYSYQRGETRAAVVQRMQAAMDKALAEAWAARSDGAAVSSPEEAIILASIIEKETGKPEEREMVAGVMTNRLNIGMRLGADATTIYPITNGRPLGRRIRVSELRDPNPYNTRAISGLPVGPITNPGIESIRAALNPAETDALYYVADGTGGHVFARSLEEHNANVKEWRRIREERGL